MGRVLVVGAGVVGLTCAARLLASGHRVDVVARDLPRETVSAVAAAIWFPFHVGPADRVPGWSDEAYEVFTAIAAEEPDSGVTMRHGTDLVIGRAERPGWMRVVPDAAETLDVPAPYAAGWSATVPVVEMPVYLDWLTERVRDLGGSVTRLNLSTLPVAGPDAPGGPDVVVNCTGIGAKHLAADPSVHPIQGQVVLVDQVGLERWCQTDDDPAGPIYVIPRSRDIVVGGTTVAHAWSRTPSPTTATEILRRALRIVPELAGAEVVGHRVGLRPARPEVRLEVDGGTGPGAGWLVHCYGHGGGGVTLSWGCAAEVARLVDVLLQEPPVEPSGGAEDLVGPA